MTTSQEKLKDDQILVIRLDCKLRKCWKKINGVNIAIGARVNIMRELVRPKTGLNNLKEALLKVRMANEIVL